MNQTSTTWQKLKSHPQRVRLVKQRAQVLSSIRTFFTQQDFVEVETPLLVKQPGTEPYLEVFQTTLKVADGSQHDAFLLTSPEYAMKKLLVAGMPKIFQICKSFRNGEGIGPMHNHEFTIMEWYRAGADYNQLMTDCEELFQFVAEQLYGTSSALSFQGKKYDIDTPWLRFTVAELFEKYIGVSKDELVSNALLNIAREKGHSSVESWDEAFTLLMMNDIEHQIAKLNQPIFIYDYPASQAALSRKKADDPRFAERFELFFAGIEIANAFSELTDAAEQKQRCQQELLERKKMGRTEYGLDNDFFAALEAGMPESAGIALGIDRLIMVMLDQSSIKDVLLFPVDEVFELK